MNAEIWYFPIAAIVNAFTSGFLGFYIIFKANRKKINYHLFIFCLSVSLWSFGYFIWQLSSTSTMALLFSRLLMIPAIFTSIFYLHLVLVFLDYENVKKYKILLKFFYYICSIWVILDVLDIFFGTGLFIDGLYAVSYFKFWPTAGLTYIFFIIFFIFHFSYASFLLFKNYFKKVGDKRMQILLMALGMLLGFLGGSTNYPLWFGIYINPWGNILVSVYVVLTVYAMLKYRFLDIKVVVAELFTGLIFIIFLVDVFLSNSLVEIILRATFLLIGTFFGVLLIRSVRKEIRRREEVTELAHSLEKANLRLQELDRQKTDFLSIASHQLRTPLSILKGYIELIIDGAYGKPTKKIVGILNEMDESNERLVKLVDEFLDITRIEQGRTKFDFSKSDVNKIIESVVKELKDRGADKGLKIAWKASSEPLNVMMDEEKIRHVVFNFVDNAIKYSEKGIIKVIVEKSEDKLIVKVKDHGFGFGKEDEANFFQKFYRGKNVIGTNVNGTGLGIYVCKKFIEAHSGKVWAKSPGLDKGSEFGFWIPMKGLGNEETKACRVALPLSGGADTK